MFSVNYIVGTGVFGVPFAFYSGGILLTTLCIACAALASLCCAVYVMESMARSEGVISWWEQRNSVGPVSALSVISAENYEQTHQERFFKQVNSELINEPDAYSSGCSSSSHVFEEEEQSSLMANSHSKPENIIKLRKFDFTFMCSIFVGDYAKYFCQLTMFLYCYGCLWAFVSVFSSSVSTLFFEYVLNSKCDIYDAHESPGCRYSYYAFVALYAAVVIPLSLVDLGEQIYIQVTLTLYRFSAFAVMVFTCTYGIIYNWHHGKRDDTFEELLDEMSIKVFDMGGFAVAFSSTVVAINFHYNLPDVLQPVEPKKGNLRTLVYAAMLTASVIYIAVGVSCAYFFGDKTEPLSTLNWKTYTACGNGWDPCPRNYISVIVSFLFVFLLAHYVYEKFSD